MKALILISSFLFLAGCSQVSTQAIQFDKESHEALLATATERVRHVACDVGFVEGLGITDELRFPIQSHHELRPIMKAAGVSLALVEMADLTKSLKDETGKRIWSQDEYLKCKILGISYRAGAIGTVELLKLIPDLAPYLSMIAPK